MGFALNDLAIESVMRDGFAAIRRDPTIIDDVFSQLKNMGTITYDKYGDKEITRIKNYFIKNEVSIVQSFSQVTASMPCISIQLVDGTESSKLSHIDDFEDDTRVDLTDPEDLAALIKLSDIELDAYDPKSGTVYVADSADLTKIYANETLVDSEGSEFTIIGGIDNTSGKKQLVIETGDSPDLSGPALVKSSIDFKQFETRGNIEDEKFLMGVHTKERLLTIYLFILVKYFITSRKKDLISRGLQNIGYSGSDFTRNNDYVEPVFSRYLTVSGIAQNNWMSDKVIPIDSVEVQVLVPKDVKTTEDLDLEDSTVQVSDDEQ